MCMGQQYKDVVLFITLYLVLSLVPFLVFNQSVLGDIRDRVAPLDVVTIGIVGTGLFVLISALFLMEEGIDRYNQFLFAPTDLLSVLVALSFLAASISWWVVPEIAFRMGPTVSFDLLIVAVLSCQLPMILFLSLLTAVGKA